MNLILNQYQLGSPKLRRILIALLMTVLISAAWVGWNDKNSTSMIRRGDFPGFYVLAEILHRGLEVQLYDRKLQTQIENEIWPSMDGSVLVSVYPAYTAVMLKPLAWFSASYAQLLFIVLNITVLLVGLKMLLISNNIQNRTDLLILSLLFPPLTIALLSAQNTAITVGLVCMVVALLTPSQNQRQGLIGILLALLLYKPQFGILLALPLLLQRGNRGVRLSFVLTAALMGYLSFHIVGWDWPVKWWELLKDFAPENFAVNGSRMVSLGSFIYWLDSKVLDGSSGFASIVGFTLSMIIYLLLAIRYLKARADLSREFLFFAAAITILSPQTLFYDLGIFIPLILFQTAEHARLTVFIAMAVTAIMLFLLLKTGGFPYFFIAASLYLIWSMRKARLGAEGR